MIEDGVVFEDILAIIYVIPDEFLEEISEFIQKLIIVLLFLLQNGCNVLQLYGKLLFCIIVTTFYALIHNSLVNIFDIEIKFDDEFSSLSPSLLLVKISSILYILILHYLITDMIQHLLKVC